jgi:hypothetical protein
MLERQYDFLLLGSGLLLILATGMLWKFDDIGKLGMVFVMLVAVSVILLRYYK